MEHSKTARQQAHSLHFRLLIAIDPAVMPATPPPVRVAIVAASLRILGGQAVQAQRLLDNWLDDLAVRAWLVPIDPVPRAPLDRLLRVKYVRTLVTQLLYWP